MPPKVVLVVDDDPKMRRLLRRCLEGEGFAVVEAESEQGVMDSLRAQEISLITLDISLGNESGLVIARDIRQDFDVPIIMVTARGDVIDRVVGLEIGADDYITKPFHVRELSARIRAQIRRAEGATVARPSPPEAPSHEAEVLEFDGMTVDAASLEVRNRDGTLSELTTAETRLLLVFLTHPKRVLSRDQIMTFLSGVDWTPLDRTIDNKIARLRKKIERTPHKPQLIKTARGIGYIFTASVSPKVLTS